MQNRIDHGFEANRCRNIIAAIQNLINQMHETEDDSELYQEAKKAMPFYGERMAHHLRKKVRKPRKHNRVELSVAS